MESISTSAELKKFILVLETEQQARGEELKMQFFTTYRDFKPYSLLANVFKKALPSTNMSENILIGGMSIVTGYLVKKMVVGMSADLTRKLTATALQAGTSALVTHNAGIIKAIGQFIFGMIDPKTKEGKSV